MDIFDALNMLGGLALFLFGMNVMGQGLERAAGNQLKTILERLTSSPIRGFFLGLAVTAVIQSSSATTVMVVGFVSSSVMTLYQAVGIIMGANVGTTVTAWLLSLNGIDGAGFIMKLLKPTSFSPVLAAIGVILFVFCSDGRKKDVGSILLGFATLMFGMNAMSTAVSGLKDVPEFANILLLFSNPILGVLAGAVLTAIIQSSSASVGILQALSSTGALTFGSAVPIILGQNIGTTVTALISSAGASKNARRAALIHLYFNLIGTFSFLILFYIVKALIPMPILNGPASEAGISVVHTLFNVVSTAAMLPFNKQLVKLACLTIKDEAEEPPIVLLDERMLVTPTIALDQCTKLTQAMASLSTVAVDRSLSLLREYNDEDASLIREIEGKLDEYEDTLGSFLVKLSAKSLSAADSGEISRLLHAIGDFERISDYAKSIQKSADRLREKGQTFSGEAMKELDVLSGALRQVTLTTAYSFSDNDLPRAHQVEPLEQVVDYLASNMKSRHIARLKDGSCSVDQGILFTDILNSCRRISDHCSNVAASLIGLEQENYDTHQNLGSIKKNDAEFKELYDSYMAQYPLP